MPDTEPHLLSDIETAGRIFEPAIEGFALWPVVRPFAWQTLQQIKVGSTDPRLWRRLLRQPVVLTMPLYAAWSKWQRMRLRQHRGGYLFHSTEGYRSVKRTDGWWNVYLDDIANHPDLRDDVMRSENRIFAISPLRTSAPRHLFTDGHVLSMSLGALFKKNACATAQAEQTLSILTEELAERGKPLSDKQAATLRVFMTQSAQRFRQSLHWFRGLLAETTPRAIVLTNAYNEHGLVAAARERKLPVVEFQHGVISVDHPGYIWPEAARQHRARLSIPDFIATYGDYWSDRLVQTGFWKADEVPAIGSVRMDRVRAEHAASSRERDALDIVFTTQFASREWTVPLLRAFIDLAHSQKLALRLTIKVHRREQQYLSEYRVLSRNASNVRIMSAFEGDTLALIADADVHVSAWSTCHFEAVGLATPTIVLLSDGPNPVADLRQFSNVHEARSATDLLESIRTLCNRSSADTALAHESRQLFKPQALDSAVSLLRKIVPARQ